MICSESGISSLVVDLVKRRANLLLSLLREHRTIAIIDTPFCFCRRAVLVPRSADVLG